MQPMCAPLRRASCSYTKASLKTLSQYWWGFSYSLCFIDISLLLFIFISNLSFFILFKGNGRKAEELRWQFLLLRTVFEKDSSLPAEKVISVCVCVWLWTLVQEAVLTDVLSFVSSLEEECEAPLCTAALTAKNQELQGDMKRVTSMFEKLHNYINILALPSKFSLSLD